MSLNLTVIQKNSILAGISLLAISSFFFIPAIPQNLAYHQFADQRPFLTIPHFSNTFSNILFIVVGFLGTTLVLREKSAHFFKETYWMHLTFFVAIFFVGLGSGYYHLAPTNQTLIWDRLPMTVAFMALFSIIFSEFISVKLGKTIFFPLVLLGILSIAYWIYTEQLGNGDLRLYGLVQFLPITLIPLILIMFKSESSCTQRYWYLFGFYVLAKIFEIADEPVYQSLSIISGHSIKHLCAGFGCLVFYFHLRKDLKAAH